MRRRSSGVAAGPQLNPNSTLVAATKQGPGHRSDGGFTLVELLIVTVIVPIIVGSIALALISIFSLQGDTSGRLIDSGNAQVTSSVFLKDVQSAALITEKTFPTLPQCASASPTSAQHQLLGLAWNGSGGSPGGYSTYVSYVWEDSGTAVSLVRLYCSGGSTTATDANTTTIVTDLDMSQTTAPTITCTPSWPCDPSQWIKTNGVRKVTFHIFETQSHVSGQGTTPFQFTLSAVPRLLSEVSYPSTPNTPFAPLTLLGSTSTCDASGNASPPVLVTGNSANSKVTIQVGPSPSGSGMLAVGSQCNDSLQLGNNTVLGTSGIVTADPSSPTISGGNSSSIPKYPTNQVLDPFVPPSTTALVKPTFPSTNSPVSCTKVGQVATCPPGYYNTDPGSGTAKTYNFTGGGTYWFGAGLSLGSNTGHFSSAVYIFGGPFTASALSLGSGTIDEPSGTSGVLFYINHGTVQFGNQFTVNNLTGHPAYDGVAIWDAYASGQNAPVSMDSNAAGAYYSGGGIYVPSGGIVALNNVAITATFIVADWAKLSNNDDVIINPSP